MHLPDGRTVTRGELLARANQLVHGLRALGLTAGDTVAVVLPNGLPMVELYLGRAPGRALPHADQPPPRRPRDRVHRRRLRGQGASSPTSASPTTVTKAPHRDSTFPAERRFAVGDIAGLPALRRAHRRASPTTPPEDRTAGAVMHYTSGTTGRPKGVAARCPTSTPTTSASCCRRASWACSASSPLDGNVAHHAARRSTTRRCSCGRPTRCTSATPSCSWTSGRPRRCCSLIDEHQVTTSHMVPTQFHRLLAPARGRAGQVRRVVAAQHDPRRGAVPARGQAPDDRVVGRLDQEYYAATEGGGTIVTAEEWLEKPGTVGTRLARLARSASSTTTATSVPGRHRGHRLHAPGPGDFEYKGDKEKTERQPHRRLLHRRRLRLLDEDGYLFLCDRKSRHDHLGRREHLPGRDRGRAAQPPEGRRRRRVRHPARRLGRGGQGRRRARRRASRRGDDAARPRSWPCCAETLAKFKRPRIDRLPRRSCPATPTASSTSASCATPTGRARPEPVPPNAVLGPLEPPWAARVAPVGIHHPGWVAVRALCARAPVACPLSDVREGVGQLPEVLLGDLAERRGRELVHEVDGAGHLEVGQVLAGRPR